MFTAWPRLLSRASSVSASWCTRRSAFSNGLSPCFEACLLAWALHSLLLRKAELYTRFSALY